MEHHRPATSVAPSSETVLDDLSLIKPDFSIKDSDIPISLLRWLWSPAAWAKPSTWGGVVHAGSGHGFKW